jgi:hypothetical protein
MGLLEFDAIETPFHNMKAVDKTRAKLRTWAIDCRALDRLPARADSIVGGISLAGRDVEVSKFSL